MRLERLDLTAYGCFEGKSLHFPASARLHIVYGPNEAGKSTTLAAISDLLFGFKAKDHPYTFKFAKPLLGGRLVAADGTVLEFVRQRARGGAGLTTPDQRTALDDDALAPFLPGVGKEEFERLYSLNHARLRDGGAELLKPDSDIGRKLFAAGSGLEDLHKVEASLAADLDRLGENISGRRGRGDQALKAAAQDYDAAEKDFKAAALKATDLARARDRVIAAAQAAEAAGRRALAAGTAQARAARIRRTRPLLAELDRLRAAAGARATFPDLPAELAERWAEARRDDELAAADERRAGQAAADAAAEQAALPPAGPFATQAAVVAALSAQLGEYIKAGKDLPRCQAERRLKLESVADGLRALGLDPAGDPERLTPPRAADAADARDLAARRRDARNRLADADQAAAKARVDQAAAEADVAALGPPVDISEAAATATEAEALRDAPDRLEKAAAAARQAQAVAARAAAAAATPGRWSGDPADLAALVVPTSADIADFEEESRELALRDRTLAADIAREEEAQTEAAAKIAALRRIGEPPARAAVEAARRRRDDAIRGLAAGEGTAETALAAAAAADQLADRRTEEAKQVQAFESALERQAVAADRLNRLSADRQALTATRDALTARWRAMWGPVAAGKPADMRDWLTARTAALAAAAAAERATLEHKDAAERFDRWAGLWRAVAVALDLAVDPAVPPAQAAEAVAARARHALQTAQRQADERRRRTARAAETAKAAGEAALETERRRAAAAELETAWARAMARLGQRADVSEAGLESALGHWAAIDAALRDSRDLDHRIAGMGRDRAAFEAQVAELRAALQAGGVALPADPQQAVEAARAGMEAETRLETLRGEKRRALAAAEKQAQAAKARRERTAAACAAIRAAHGLTEADDPAALCAVAEARRRLPGAGDGLDEAALRAEIDGSDPDAAAANLPLLAQETAQARADHEKALTGHGEAKAEWDRLQREAGAEAAAARRNEAARRAAAAAAEILRLKAAQILLRRAVERYRAANQDPLLARASALFAAVAAAAADPAEPGPIIGLDARIGDDGRPTLHAVRRDDSTVAVEGLSEGSADQLFLALRLAALEQRAAAGRPMPFIADDIFMSFDDARAAAGLRLLAEMGKTTQMIVFTHHAFVVDAALQAAEPGAVNVVNLARPR